MSLWSETPHTKLSLNNALFHFETALHSKYSVKKDFAVFAVSSYLIICTHTVLIFSISANKILFLLVFFVSVTRLERFELRIVFRFSRLSNIILKFSHFLYSFRNIFSISRHHVLKTNKIQKNISNWSSSTLKKYFYNNILMHKYD